MGKYLKKFETTSQYNAYTADTANFIKPNVSLITETNTVEYNPLVTPPTPPTPSHEYVEIGGLKWATMNIGASSVTDYGLYFQWGDVSGYTASQVGTDKVFNWANYKFNPSGDGETFTKYNYTDGKTVLDASDDAAVANWGNGWRIPTTAEFQALGNAVNTAWTADYQGSGVAGLVLTDKTDNSKVLFFPANGVCFESSVQSVGSNGSYYSSSISDYDKHNAYSLDFRNNSTFWNYYYGERYIGFSVRPVVDE